jgi:hypothetical protein
LLPSNSLSLSRSSSLTDLRVFLECKPLHIYSRGVLPAKIHSYVLGWLCDYHRRGRDRTVLCTGCRRIP